MEVMQFTPYCSKELLHWREIARGLQLNNKTEEGTNWICIIDEQKHQSEAASSLSRQLFFWFLSFWETFLQFNSTRKKGLPETKYGLLALELGFSFIKSVLENPHRRGRRWSGSIKYGRLSSSAFGLMLSMIRVSSCTSWRAEIGNLNRTWERPLLFVNVSWIG